MGHYTERADYRAFLSLLFAVSSVVAIAIVGIQPAFSAGTSGSVKNSKLTRFIVGLDRKAKFKIIALSKPNRVVVELEDTKLRLPAQPKSGPVGLVSGFLGGRAGPGRSRIVIHVTEPVVVAKSSLEQADGGYHLSLEIAPLLGPSPRPPRRLANAPFAKPSGLGAGNIQPPMPQAALSRASLNKRHAKPIIVLDPGHGGHDSGAKKNGAVEKQVVLAFAKTLRTQLEASGRYKILMTRDTDKFVPLKERRDFAERHNASLFIAIHADYARAAASGATIYSLRNSVAKRLKKSAVRKAGKTDIAAANVASIGKNDRSVVSNWLSDLARQDAKVTKVRSDLFSRSVIRHMGAKTAFRSKPHRTAAFKVLKTHLVPSVLIELAFVTNKADAKRLKSESWRKKVSSGIASAIDNYFSQHAARLPVMAGMN
ncbi:MAG: N-acetylmuramoyl-L-alanine amidase [Alphaproteobacteria bacterium]|nr:N-acetylmuramoyl-L-alanine amidase [Alphaproteobacteria bacterium]